jgi:tetratricopeptide (TPR) repeat protein
MPHWRKLADGFSRLPVALLWLALSGCAALGPPLPDAWPSLPAATVNQVPFFAQDNYQCGPASLAMVLRHSGIDTLPAALKDQVYLPQRRGSLQADMLATSRRHGRIPFRIPPTLTALATELQQQRPVLVLQNLGLKSHPVWHYAVVTAVQPQLNTVTLHSGTTENLVTSVKKFYRSWDLADRWGIILLKPGELPTADDPLPFLKAVADYQSVMKDHDVIKSYAAAIHRWPTNTLAWFSYARVSEDQDDLPRAVSAYQQSLRLEPNYLPSRNNLARLYAQQGCRQEALLLIDRGLKEQPNNNHEFSAVLKQTRQEILQQKAIQQQENVNCLVF